MISWIQHHLIRHGRWIFLCLLAIVIVAFVFTIGNTPGCTTQRTAYQEAEFYGVDLNAPRERERLNQKVALSVLLRTGRAIQSDEQFQSELLSRVALLHLADRLDIPVPGEAELKEFVRTRPPFTGPDGTYSADAFAGFIDRVRSNPRMPDELLVEVLEEDHRMEQVAEALSGPGYLLPAEAAAQYRRRNTRYTLGTATLDFNAFAPEIEPTEDELRDYFEANQPRYEIPERIRAAYVHFPADAYAEAVEEPGEAALRAHFVENRARFVAEHEAAQTPADRLEAAGEDGDGAEDAETAEKPPVTFEDVREAVRADWVRMRAKRLANEAAQEFAYALYDRGVKRDSAAFNQLLNGEGLSLKPIEPYTREGLRRRSLPADMLQAAFDLSPARYFSDPYPLDDGYGILLYEGRIEPQMPEYATVAEAVRTDYTEETRRRLFNEKGETLRAELEAKLSEGTPFVEAAEALGLEARAYEPFTPAGPPRDLNPSALARAADMDAGDLSPMVVTRGIGTFVHVIDREAPEPAEDSEELEQAKSMLRGYHRMLSSGALVNELVARGMPEQ